MAVFLFVETAGGDGGEGVQGQNFFFVFLSFSSLTPSLADGPARRGKEQGSGSQGRTGREGGRARGRGHTGDTLRGHYWRSVANQRECKG